MFKELCKHKGKFYGSRLTAVHRILREKNINLIRQKGGDIIRINSEGHTYIINSDTGIFYDTEDNEMIISFVSLNGNQKCGALLIDRGNKEAIIQDISGHEDCTRDENLKKVEKIGRKFVKIMIKICKLYGVKKISLMDNSKYHCPNGDRIDLLLSRTLTQAYPFYEKFGFKPSNLKDLKTMESNAQIMEELAVGEIKWEKLFGDKTLVHFIKNKNELPHIKKLISNNHSASLFELCQYLLENYCSFMAAAVPSIYELAGLRLYFSREFVKYL